LIKKTSTDFSFYLHPWETIIQGHQSILKSKNNAYVKIIQDMMLTKELRLWHSKSHNFVDHIYEHLNTERGEDTDVVLYSQGFNGYEERLELLERWKTINPTLAKPFYYQACILLALKKYDEFLKISEHYMFLEKKTCLPSVMNRYYYSLVQIMKKNIKPALQNLNLCICTKPLMAEFWCALGDAHYFLLNNFSHARQFYKNAILLGSRRLNNDKWPMEISKYKEYPNKMIEACNVAMSQTYSLGIHQ
jgi:tetratricopeptide (TPR) repeat protein